MTKDAKILFFSAVAGITFMLGVLTGDHFGQRKGYSKEPLTLTASFEPRLTVSAQSINKPLMITAHLATPSR